MPNVVRQEKYIKSDIVKNNNKFWYITLYDNDDVLTEWGRVGDKGQSKCKPSVGAAFFDKKCREKEKSRNGEIPYRKLNVVTSNATVTTSKRAAQTSNIKEVAKKQIKSNNPIVLKLIDYLAKVNAHQISTATGGKITYSDTTGLFSTPLGIITQQNIDDANAILVDVGNLVADGKFNTKLGSLTNDYMMLVPQDVGHKRVEVSNFWANLTKVQAQKQILDNLQASIVSAQSTPTRKKTVDLPEEQVFDCQLHLVDDKKEIKRIREFYRKTNQSVHACSHLDVKTVYSVDINTVNTAFASDGGKMDNVWELWHGTRASNLLSILKGGLIIPPSNASNVTGRMFGNGVYASDQSTKALNYAYGYWGGSQDNNCFMFLLNMAMGNFHVPRGPFRAEKAPKGFDSTFAKGRQSGVGNNEMIVYRTSQIKLSRLIEFAPKGR